MVSKLGTGSSNAEEQELRDAAERGDIGEVARLIESGVSVNAVYIPNYDEVSRRKVVANRIELDNGIWCKKHGNKIFNLENSTIILYLAHTLSKIEYAEECCKYRPIFPVQFCQIMFPCFLYKPLSSSSVSSPKARECFYLLCIILPRQYQE